MEIKKKDTFQVIGYLLKHEISIADCVDTIHARFDRLRREEKSERLAMQVALFKIALEGIAIYGNTGNGIILNLTMPTWHQVLQEYQSNGVKMSDALVRIESQIRNELAALQEEINEIQGTL